MSDLQLSSEQFSVNEASLTLQLEEVRHCLLKVVFSGRR